MSRIYPFTLGEAQSAAWDVRVDGARCPLHLARVSAYPINRRWPGHQRSPEETELCAFALFETDGPASVEIRPARPVKEVVVRPLSRGVAPELRGGVIRFTLPGPGQYTVEADSSHGALHLFADPPADRGAAASGEGVIYYGRGVHDAGLITLRSGQTLFIDEGAVVYARVEARDAQNIHIAGRGILDGSRNVEQILAEMGDEQREAYEKGWAVPNAIRRHTVELSYCDDVTIEGVTIRDSLVYSVRPVCCRRLTIDGVKIIGNWRYNSDGIDMHNCQAVRLRRCFVRTFDDAICVKGFDYTQDEADMRHGGVLYDEFSDVLVEKCVVWCDWGKSLEFGAETRAREIRHVTFRDCDLIHNCAVALDVLNVDYADIHDVLFDDIRVEYPAVSQKPRLQTSDGDYYVEDPRSDYMPQLLGCSVTYIPEYSASGEKRGRVRDVTFRNIRVTAPAMPPSAFSGCDGEHGCEDILIDGLYLNGRRAASLEEARVSADEFVRRVTLR